MTKAKRKKPNCDEEPMDVDEDEAICSTGENGRAVANDRFESDSEEELHMSEDEDGGCHIGGIYIPPPPKPALTFDATGPRMIISHIVNENFKSYAGIQYLGPFHKSFTAIIGPNGSGKSNVIDSMLFVFGYRASKIRSKKVSVMIHNSSKYPDVQSTTVAVHFCKIIDGDGEDFSIVPDSELVVARTAFKDNTSYYALNGKKVHFKEVSKLLVSHGIDLEHNRFLILQGEVEQIAMMKPKSQNEHDFGMLEYLEDIVGTSRYKDPLDNLSSKVEDYTERRKEKLNRVRLVEAEKTKLEQPMIEAVEMMNLTNQSMISRNLLLQKYIHETNKLRRETEASMAEKQCSLDEINDRLNLVGKDIEDKNIILKEGTKKYDIFQKKKESLAERLHSCKKKTVVVQADITQGNKKKKNLDQLLEQERGKLIEYELIPEKNTREIADCEKLLEKHNVSKRKAEEELQTIIAGVREQTRGLTDTKDRLQAKLVGLKRIVDEENKSFKLAESELKIYLSTETKETERLQKLTESYEKAMHDLEEKKRIKKELTSSLPTDEKQLVQIQTQLQDFKREEASLLGEMRTLRSQLEESRQKMSANKSRGRVLDALMKEKQKGNIPGIFGRLGDLGGIDVKYDVAISTCCGQLDNIVVDSVETGQACVEFLKQHDIGRATFVALDKQTHLIPQLERRQTFPENVPRLFDLIKVKDERVLPAFYFALRDTLVAKDLEQASRIAYGATRHRVVSLKGDVIEVAGTMSGGGKTTTRGRMSSSVQQDTSEQDPALIQASERRLEALEERLTEVRSQQVTLEDFVVTLQRSVRDGRITLEKATMELTSLTEQVPTLKKQIKQQESKVASCRVDEDRKQELESVIEEAEERLEKAKRDAGEVEKEVHGVDAQITAVGGGRVKDVQKKVDELAGKVNKLTTEMTKLKVAINTSNRNGKKSKEKIAQMEADLAGTEKKLEELGEQKKQLTLENAQLQKEIDEIEEQLSEGSEEFTGLKKEIAKLQDTQSKIKSEKIDMQSEISKHERIIKECKCKTPVWEKEITELVLEQIPPDDNGIVIPGLEPVEPLRRHTDEELDAVEVEELRARCKMHKQRLGDDKPNTQAVLDYRIKEALYLKRAAELDNITTKRNRMRDSYDNLRKRRQNEFLAGFNTITTKLKEMYQMITLGGDAELELVDSLDPFTEGIIFSVRPPNKSWKNISNLSGGEKTLSSLALVFALHYYKPTPLYVMDEIDAALDFKNVSIVANYIKDRTKNAQFIIISLRYIMFETSNRLVGIYKTDDCTKSVTIENINDDELPFEIAAL